MTAVNTGNIAKLLWPGLNAIWGEYKDHPGEYTDLFDIVSSSKAYEEDQLLRGLGLAPIKTEGAATQYDGTSQGLTSRYTHLAYSLGFVVTREAMEDNQYKSKALRAMKMLARSFKQTKETVSANVYNRAHNSSYTGADGVVLCSTAHPTYSGNQSNTPGHGGGLLRGGRRGLCVQINNAIDEQGPEDRPDAPQAADPDRASVRSRPGSEVGGQNDTANNAINALKALGIFPDGAAINHYFDDADAFFIRTDAPDGMKMFERTAPEFAQDNDFDTSNLKYKGYERNSFGWTDFRGVYSNGGGA
jgi:hypothetical protein